MFTKPYRILNHKLNIFGLYSLSYIDNWLKNELKSKENEIAWEQMGRLIGVFRDW